RGYARAGGGSGEALLEKQTVEKVLGGPVWVAGGHVAPQKGKGAADRAIDLRIGRGHELMSLELVDQAVCRPTILLLSRSLVEPVADDGELGATGQARRERRGLPVREEAARKE